MQRRIEIDADNGISGRQSVLHHTTIVLHNTTVVKSEFLVPGCGGARGITANGHHPDSPFLSLERSCTATVAGVRIELTLGSL